MHAGYEDEIGASDQSRGSSGIPDRSDTSNHGTIMLAGSPNSRASPPIT
jgi:hypothetical protein